MQRRCLGVLDLAGELERLTAAEFTPPRVFEHLQGVSVLPDSLQPYTHFDRTRYTRNLVYLADRFEMLALCWEPGQRSTVHNHSGQQCWMLVPTGRLLNQNYRVVEEDADRQWCRLEPTSVATIDPEHPLQVNTAEPVHHVENPAGDHQRAISIHIYSLPYDRCLVYSLETGRYGEVQLHYQTRFGAPVD